MAVNNSAMKPWTRNCTREWIEQAVTRFDDLQFYLSVASKWCNEHEVYSDQAAFMCSVMTLVWVANMRGELISKREIFEILQITDWHLISDDAFELNAKYSDLDLEQLLEQVLESFY